MTAKRNYRLGWIILAGVLAAAFPGTLAASPVTYTYTGPRFQVAFGPYTTSDFVSGYFTVPTALPDGYFDFTPATYSFSDGVQTISNANSPIVLDFNGITDSSGELYGWTIDLVLPNGSMISTLSDSADTGIYVDSAGEYEGVVDDFPGGLDEGSWVVSGGTSPVPEPGNVALMALGLVGIGLVRRKIAAA